MQQCRFPIKVCVWSQIRFLSFKLMLSELNFRHNIVFFFLFLFFSQIRQWKQFQTKLKQNIGACQSNTAVFHSWMNLFLN